MARGDGVDAAARLDVGVEMVRLQTIEAQPAINTPGSQCAPHAAVDRDRRELPQCAIALSVGQSGIKCRNELTAARGF